MLEEIFDPDFTASNFGFRRGRSQHQAIGHLQRLVKEGREWTVAVDLKLFFDEIPLKKLPVCSLWTVRFSVVAWAAMAMFCSHDTVFVSKYT